ncbi:MAG: FAD-binding oxidoreductase [Burkholderiales bacterium]|nr:FAD-binding oxidoreductase [Burkholderiales bacterium]
MKSERLPGRDIDVPALHARLRAALQCEVRFDAGTRALYATDSSNYRQVPIGVVIPRSTEDIVTTVAICRELDAPILMRGAGTSLCGQTCNVAVVLDVSRHLTRIVALDSQARTAVVEPGVVCDSLRDAAQAHGLTFGPDPATHSRCTLGGMVGNNACGAHSVMAGKTVENVEALEILTYDGERFWVGPTSERELEGIVAAGGRKAQIYSALARLAQRHGERVRDEFPRIRRRVSGYNLDELLPENGFNVARALVGSEGTCAIVLRAKVKLVVSPTIRVLVVLGYDDMFTAGDRTPHVLAHAPIALEGLDRMIIDDLAKKNLLGEDIALLPEGNGWLMVELGADDLAQAQSRAEALIAAERRAGFVRGARFYPGAEQHKVWAIREVGAGASNAVPGVREEPYAGWEDAAVEPARVGDYLREFRDLLDKYGYRSSLYGHFGDGCIHGRISFDFRTRAGIHAMRAFMEEATDLVVKYGGSISGEHGDGQARAEFLPRMYGPELMQAFRDFKAIWDPRNRMNPGKLVDAYKVDENLKIDSEYRPIEAPTRFSFAADFGSFAHAAERCMGVAKCRNLDGGVMCPSYRVTRDEKHSTRGRIRLFGELFRGETLTGLWTNEDVKSALDLCFSCKSCKRECPVQVDMATYKAEFLSHYYEHHPRPRQARSMGRIQRWARWASVAPGLVNALNRAPGVGALSKHWAGIARERSIPRFAARTFRAWFEARPPAPSAGTRIVLWADTFNNHFHPETAIAATRVLEAAGYAVAISRRQLCCGRPLYDFGLLDVAKRQLAQIMDALAPEIEAGTPIVGLEPACVSVFKDELLDFFPGDARAASLARQVVYFSDFLQGEERLSASASGLRARVHGHCHHKALIGMAGEMALLRRAGIDARPIDSSCCGMAGSFGFRPETYALSVQAAELKLLPAVRTAGADEIIIASGYSCREQIDQLSARKAVHVAEAVAQALGQAPAEAR